MVGLELRDTLAVAVAVDGRGQLLARAEVETGSDPSAAEVASAGIVRRLVWRIKAGDRSRVQDLVNGDLAAITLEQVLDGAREGDGVSISVVRDTAKYLGMAAANLIAIADPEMLVLGGI